MARLTILCLLGAALGSGALWVADAARPAGTTLEEPAPHAVPPALSTSTSTLEVRGDLRVSAWLGDARPDEEAQRMLRDWLPASEVTLRGDVAVVRWRESVTATRASPAGWAVLPLSQLRALIAVEEPDASRVTTLEVDLRAAPAATIVSLDQRRILPLPGSEQPAQDVAGDLWIDPADPGISGIGSSINGHRHLGDDTGVAVLPASGPAFDELQVLPAPVQWQQAIPEETIAPGVTFLARSSSGRVYKVRIDDLEKLGRRMRLSFARLRMP